MNEPFLLSNLIELQELDNEIFKLISHKSEGENVKKLKSLEMNFNQLQKNKQNFEENLKLYFDAKDHIEKNIIESQLKIDTINEKLGSNLDASELQNYNLQKQNFEKNLLDFENSLTELNNENKDELDTINEISQSLEELKPKPDLAKTSICPRLGYCKKKGCTYAHSREELRSTESFAKTKVLKKFYFNKFLFNRMISTEILFV